MKKPLYGLCFLGCEWMRKCLGKAKRKTGTQLMWKKAWFDWKCFEIGSGLRFPDWGNLKSSDAFEEEWIIFFLWNSQN